MQTESNLKRCLRGGPSTANAVQTITLSVLTELSTGASDSQALCGQSKQREGTLGMILSTAPPPRRGGRPVPGRG